MFNKNHEKNEIAHIAKLSELEQVRNDIAESLAKYDEVLGKLDCMFDGLNLHLTDIEKFTSFYSSEKQVQIDRILAIVDQRLWDLAISTSGVSAVLSSEGESELRKRYKEKPVPFTADEANHVIERLAESSPMLAASTLRSIFEKLTSTHFRRGNGWIAPKENRSHDKIRKSFRFSHFSSFGKWSCYTQDSSFDLFNDLELVCRMLNHLPKLRSPNRLGDLMSRNRWVEGGFPREFKSDHFMVLVFKCGNVKIDFTCDKTLALLNRYGADGKTLVDPLGDVPNRN